MKNRKVVVSLEKTPKDPLDVLDEEPKLTTEQKVDLVKEIGCFAAGLYFFKVGTDAFFTVLVQAAAKGLK